MIYFTSDEHYNHFNIIEYSKRPFKSVKEMDKVLMNLHNETVSEKDTVFHLGDFSMVGPSRVHFYEKLMEKFRPVKSRHLILGNHDELKPFTYIRLGFSSVHTAFWTTFGKVKIFMVHDPSTFAALDDRTLTVCGHIHHLFKSIPEHLVYNVGVDENEYRPVSLDQILEEFKIAP